MRHCPLSSRCTRTGTLRSPDCCWNELSSVSSLPTLRPWRMTVRSLASAGRSLSPGVGTVPKMLSMIVGVPLVSHVLRASGVR